MQTKEFKKWSKSEKLSDQNLAKAISEIEDGLVDANLGGGLIKKRVASIKINQLYEVEYEKERK